MTRLHILTAKGNEQSVIYFTPLVANRSRLADLGITFRLFYKEENALYDADCVMFENRVFRVWGGREQDQRAHALLKKLNRRVDRVLWLDTTDSTGTTQFQFLPYVHAYYKAQLLKDKGGYTRAYYGNRVFTDYYHAVNGVDDSDERPLEAPADPADLDKIRLAWNHSLGDFGPWGKYVRRLRRHLPAPLFYSAKFADPADRTVDVSARFGTTYTRATVSFHRDMVRQVMETLGAPTRKIWKREYLRELRRAKVAVSPFGWGEPSFKDYEIIISGAALIKPDMSHLATWPDLYVDGETYLSFRWDCSDLSEVIHRALANDAWREIASRAQEVYRRHLFDPKMREEFCERVRDMCEA